MRRRRRAQEPAFNPDSAASDQSGTVQTPESGGTLRTTAQTAEGEDERWQGDAAGTGTASAEGRYSRRDMRPKP